MRSDEHESSGAVVHCTDTTLNELGMLLLSAWLVAGLARRWAK